MTVTRDGDRLIADTDAMVAVTGRSPRSIRQLCARETAGYDMVVCENILAANPLFGRVMTATQAETYLGVPANRVYQWAYRRELAAVEIIGRSPAYLVEDILRLIERGQRRSSEEEPP